MKPSTQPLIEPTEAPEETPMVNGMVASEFIVRLRERFLSSEAHDELWTSEFAETEATNRKALIAADISSAFRSVFMRFEDSDSAPEPGGIGSAAKRMKEFLEDEGEHGAAAWPAAESFPVPAPYDPDAFRRYEVGCTVAVLMEAFHRSGPGSGGPTEFPPTRPS